MTRAESEVAQVECHLDDEVFMTPREVADRFRISESTLRGWRLQGVGPVPTKVMERPRQSIWRYRTATVLEFEKKNEGFSR